MTLEVRIVPSPSSCDRWVGYPKDGLSGNPGCSALALQILDPWGRARNRLSAKTSRKRAEKVQTTGTSENPTSPMNYLDIADMFGLTTASALDIFTRSPDTDGLEVAYSNLRAYFLPPEVYDRNRRSAMFANLVRYRIHR